MNAFLVCFEFDIQRVVLQMGACVKLNKVITMAVVILAGLWFFLVILLPQTFSIRLRHGNTDIQPIDDEWKPQMITHFLYSSGIQHSSLQLIEIINYGIPKAFSEQAILLVTNQWSKLDYSAFLKSLSMLKLLGEKYRIPIYVLKQKNHQHLYNYRTLHKHARSLLFLAAKCIDNHNIKKLTVIAYEEGALAALLALSEAESSFIFKIDKLVLINPFNPEQNLYQNDPKFLSEEIKKSILSDNMRLVAFQYLRIVILNTFRTAFPQQPQSRDHFRFIFKDKLGAKYILNSTLSLSSKALLSVNEFLQKGIYFYNKPFLNLLTRVIIEDLKQTLGMKEIEYILRYREVGELVQVEGVREVSRCRIVYMEDLQRNKFEAKSFCLRLVQRQRYKFKNAALIIYSHDKMELFGQDLETIPSSNYQSSKYYTSVITNLRNINEIIIMTNDRAVYFLLTSIRSPLTDPFFSIISDLDVNPKAASLLASADTLLVESCEGWRPIVGLHYNEHFKELVEWKEGDCYIQIQDSSLYPSWFIYHWNTLRNIIIFSLFCSHVLGAYTYKRFYTTLFINLMILAFFLRNIYAFQNMIITSAATFIELLTICLIKLAQYLRISNNYYIAMALLPLFSEVIGKVTVGVVTFHPSSGKFLWLQMIFSNSNSGYLITIIKFYFLQDAYNTQQPVIFSLLLLSSWQIINMPDSPFLFRTNLALAKRKITDILFLLIFCMSLGEDGNVIHQIVNFYMIIHLLLGVGEFLNKVMEINK